MSITFLKTKLFFLVVFFVTTAFVCGTGVHAATNEWSSITPPGSSGDTFNVVKVIGDYVYVGTDDGVYKSSDGGATWSQINTGLSTHLNITSIAIGWVYDSVAFAYATTSSTIVLVGTSDGGVFSSTLGGSTWTATSTGLTDLAIRDIEIDQYQATQGSFSDIYVATPSGVFISTSTASYWQLDNSGLVGQPTKLATAYGDAHIYTLTNGNRLYSSELHSSSGVYESWSQVFDASGTTTSDISVLHAIGTAGWMATDEGIYKSDDGTNWASTSIGLPASVVKNVTSDYTDANIAYASVYGDGVYRTKNEAIASPDPQIPQWLPINIGLSDMDIIEVVTDPSSSASVYALSVDGIYKLTYDSTPVGNVDLTPPSAITDLTVSATSSESSAYLTWTAPGNNGLYGTSTSYSIRYSTSTITSLNFSSATPVVPQPTPWEHGHFTTYHANNLEETGTFYFAIVAYDAAGNASGLSNVENIPITLTPAVLSAGAPSGILDVGTTDVTLSLSTDESATCKYGTSANTAYASISDTFTTTGGTSHQQDLSGLTDGAYTYYVRCRAGTAMNSSDYVISFTIDSPPAPVVTVTSSTGRSRGGGGGGSAAAITPLVGTTTMSGVTNGTSTCTTISYPSLTVDLLLNARGNEVHTVQKILILDGFLRASSTTGVFDLSTQTALQMFQRKYGIVSVGTPSTTGYGKVGPKTRAFINARLLQKLYPTLGICIYATAVRPVVAAPATFIFTRSLSLGSTGPDVKALQIYLNTHGFPIALVGTGSAGRETTYFGPATKAALVRFQISKGILPASGTFGPKTTAAIMGR